MSFLDDIKAIPITDIARQLGFSLVRKGRYYSLKEHDSTIIDVEKNCFWRNSRFARGFKGGAGSSIDFLLEFGGETDYKKSMRRLALMYNIDGSKQTENKFVTPAVQKETVKRKEHDHDLPLRLPEKDKDNDRICQYLLGRGVSEDIVGYFLERNMLYQDIRKNCVFVSPAQDFACVRGTDKKRKFVKDCDGSDYETCFFFKGNGNADRLIVAESVIDIMSIMTYLQANGICYEDYAYLATSGTNKVQSLFFHIQKEQPYIRKVYLCNDNDAAGHEADQKAMQGLQDIGYAGSCKIEKSPEGKDWNEYLDILREEK